MNGRREGVSSRLHTGLLLTAAIVVGWFVSLAELLVTGPHQLSWWGLILAVLIRSQLQTGLFIIGHDAMHGVLWPGRSRWNNALGAFALGLYAALPYQLCRRKHQRHHNATATASDPDFPSNHSSGIWSWYRQFMAGYLSWGQMTRLLTGWALLVLLLGPGHVAAWESVLLFCTLPLLISSLQLFVFGTYLPHRDQRWPDRQAEPRSLDLPPLLSLLACFHFGYHREHHDHPDLSWFELPSARDGFKRLTLASPVR